MASLTNVDSRHSLAVYTPPPPIHKDMHGSDSSVPLSPQWLLPKLGDSKLGLATGEPNPHVGKRTDPIKALENVEDLNVAEKKKDVFRPTFYGIEKGRQEHWGDEEREANSVVRPDLRREGEELGDSRKLERWSNSSSRYPGDVRRFSSERWSDSGSRESTYETRRESKWSTRWGPDDKESENRREKWSGKDGEISHDKGAHHLTSHAKDINSQGKDTDKEGEHYSRSWRSSPSVNRGRGETSPYFLSTTNKPATMFGYGRGKGDTGASVFSGDRSRVGSSSSGHAIGGPTRYFPLGAATDKSNCSHRDSPVLRYSRMKLLDIYRRTDLTGYRMSFEGFEEFPSLMQVDPLVPLALTAPIPEESVIMDAIDKGDILSSGVPQASKDGSSGKNSVESGLLPLTKSGIGDDIALVVSGHRDERTGHGKQDHSCYVESAVSGKCSRGFDSNMSSSEGLCQNQEVKLTSEAFKFEVPPKKAYDSSNREVSKLESTVPWRSQSVGAGSLWSSNDLRALTEDRSGSSDLGWLNTREEMGIEPRNRHTDSSSYLGGDSQWQDSRNIHSDVRTESRIRRQPPETIGQGGEGFTHVPGLGDPFISRDRLTDRKPQQYSSPEHLILFYKDPRGQIQGPFSGSNLIEWFDAGYFGIDLLVRPASAPADTPFSLLGDVIPQLRKRVRPPPGFGAAGLNDSVEVSNRGKVSVPGSIHAADFELMKNGQELRNESKVEAENRFLESLMSGRISRSLSESYSMSEGMQGHNGLAVGRPSLGVENMIEMKYLPQIMSLEQQSPVLSPYPPGRESPILSKEDTIREFPTPKLLSQVGEVPHHIRQSPQHVDLLSVLQSAAEKTPTPPINSALPQWLNFPEVQALKNSHGSMDIMKETIELHPNQQNSQIGFGTSPKRLQPQFQPSLLNHGFSSGVIPQEKLVASEFDQDAQMVNLLRQQYMPTQQMHSQVPLSTHLNQMELFLLMQRQKQEQQQNQLLVQQQQLKQQHLLSQALSGHHYHKHHDEQSFGPLNTGVLNENTSLKSPILQQMHEVAQSNRQLHVLDSNDSTEEASLIQVSDLSNLNLHSAQEANITEGTEHLPLNLPNQFIDLTSHSNAVDATPLMDVARTQSLNAKQLVSIPNIVSAGEESAQEAFFPRLNSLDMGTSVASQGSLQTNEIVTISSDAVNNLILSEKVEGSLDSRPFVSEMIDHVKISPGAISEQTLGGTPGLKGMEDADQREVKKASEKKSRKHKNSQLRATADYGKGSVKAAPAQKSRTNFETGVAEKDIHVEAAEPLHRRRTHEAGGENCAQSLTESLDSHDAHLPSEGTLGKKTKVDEAKVKEGDFVPSLPNNQAWKPPPGQKAKPLLEIQVEEQRRVKTQSLTVDTMPDIMPTNFSGALLAGSSNNSEQKYAIDTFQRDSLVQSFSEKPENPWNSRNRSQLHDVLATEDLPLLSGGNDIISEENSTYLPPLSQIGSQIETAVDDDFIEAKDTRKSRKKAAKNKGVAVKASLLNNSSGLSVCPSTSEQTKATRQTQQDKDLLPSPPAVPSLGDFVFWKGDQASTVPAPAWSTDSAKLQKPAFLRDIFKEQDKKTKSVQQQNPIPTPTKIQPCKGSEGSSSSVRAFGPSPSPSPSKGLLPINAKSVSPTPMNSLVLGQQKTAMEDDLFWGPLNQVKKGNRSDFPSLANPNSHKVKATPVKGAYDEGSSKKASSSKPAEHFITSSPAISQSLSKGKKDPESKYSEAMDFRDWCEGEWVRLTGTNDTSFLEFCLKQSTTEAEVLLRENLTSLDRNHEFIDKFINHKEFLSSDIIEMAFQGRRSSKVRGEDQPRESHGFRNADAEAEDGVDGSSKGKKKGKKGKKLSPALLGFNVVSKRIMMGEIQTIED